MAVKGNLSKILKKSTGSLSVTEEVRRALDSIPIMLTDIEGIKISLVGKSDVGHKHGAEDILSVDGGVWDPAPEAVVIDSGMF